MNADSNRRNGKPASCEPCRKAKIRCDHSRPACGRCLRRGTAAKCWYHPAPLTKQRSTPNATTTNHRNTSISSDSTAPITTEGTSTNSSFTQHEVRTSIRALVSRLDQIPAIKELTQKYYDLRFSSVIPASFVMSASSLLYAEWMRKEDTFIDELTDKLDKSLNTTVQIHPQTTAAQFLAEHMGESIRLEMLGLICVAAGRASLLNLIVNQEGKDLFVKNMHHISSEALRLCRNHLPQVTDALLWLSYEHVILATQLYGDTSLTAWRTLSDHTADMLAIDINREASFEMLPFFLAQLRRRLYTTSYKVDKFLANLVDRPPRLSKRHADTLLPLDLPDEVVLADVPPSEEQLDQLVTADGWASDEIVRGIAWARVGYLFGAIREEAAEFNYRRNTPETLQELRSLSQRCHETWRTLPAHVRYTPECWDSGASFKLCLTLTASYLFYLQLDYHIYHLLTQRDVSYQTSLLQVSEQMLTAVLQLGKTQCRASYLYIDFEYMVLAYGVPSGVRLAAYLVDPVQSTSGAEQLSRSSLIRQLSVLVSYLEGLHDLSSTNRAIVDHAVSSISRVLDSVLSTATTTSNAATSKQLSTDTAPLVQSSLSVADSLMLDSQDLTNMLQDIDWGSLNNDWTIF